MISNHLENAYGDDINEVDNPTNGYRQVCRSLRTERKRQNLSQVDFSIRADVSQNMSSKAASMVVPTRTIAFSGSKSLCPSVRMGRRRSFFADWTIRHPDEPNGELLQHCGPWPCSVVRERPRITIPLAFDHNGAVTAEARHGDVTLARFDGDNGEYSLLLGNAKGIDGPKGMSRGCAPRICRSSVSTVYSRSIDTKNSSVLLNDLVNVPESSRRHIFAASFGCAGR